MIDIHAHIIFGVDDGPRDIEESLSLIEKSYNQGIRKIIATSHRRKEMFETPEEIIYKNFLLIKEKAEKTFKDLELLYGSEIYYDFTILKKIEDEIYPTLASTKFVLLEFNNSIRFSELEKIINNIILLGKIPIIAHIERYKKLEFDENNLKKLINKGAYLQVNAESVLKTKLFFDKEKIFKKRARYLLKKNLVHFIATDMHDLINRKPKLKEAYRVVENQYGEELAKKIFYKNQQKLLENKKI